jgi:hypothetical protein
LIYAAGQSYDACDPIEHQQQNAISTGFALIANRGNCSFDVKALFAQKAGARLLIVTDMLDEALQRMGGALPNAGFIGIPSILVSAPLGHFVTTKLKKGEELKGELTFGEDSSSSDDWMELAHTKWAEDDKNHLLQIQVLTQKYTKGGKKEIVSWLKRKENEITNRKKINIHTDEL